MADTSRIRVAVPGAAAWAEKAHLPGFKGDDRCEVVVICDPMLDRAQAFAAQFDTPEATDDWQSAIGRDDIDLIDSCTPSGTHWDLARAAFEAGTHALCENLVANDVLDTPRAADPARATGSGGACDATDLMDEISCLTSLDSLAMHQSHMRMAVRR